MNKDCIILQILIGTIPIFFENFTSQSTLNFQTKKISDFYKLLRLPVSPILKIQKFSLGMLIFSQNLSNFVSLFWKLYNRYRNSAEKVPTNWKSVFGGSAWQWDNERKEYFLHQFYKEQPDLNLRNENVRKELRETLRFWLNLGVAGFRVDAVPHFFEDER